MIKDLRKKAKNKKGFTMVELIVVIVIILVLSAVLVPTVLKYIDKAAQANTKADAATVLLQVQADVADKYANGETTPTKVTVGDVTATKDATILAAKTTDKTRKATYVSDGDGNVISFSFADTKHWIQWSSTKGWSDVDKAL